MEKELLTIEFRYRDSPNKEGLFSSKTKVITIGVFDTLDEAIIEGNKALVIFERHFKLNAAQNKKERFSINGGCFGGSKRLITPLAYLQSPFDFYAKITRLKYEDVEETILAALDAEKRYSEHKKQNND